MDSLPLLLEQLVAAIQQAPPAYALLALFLWVYLEEAGVPLVPTADMVLLYSGYRVAQGQLDPFAIIAVTVLATVLGATTLYLVASRGGHPLLIRYQRVVRLDQGRLERVERWLQQYQGPALVAGRMIPGLKTVVSLAAGLFEVRYRPFAGYTALAATIWAVSSVTIGRLVGPRIAEVAGALVHHPHLMAGLAAVATSLLAVTLYRRFRRAA
ncbi:MAG: DedA family protein [Chloroflexi bacterium]|jgi:membrane protein DedA with SNARE-associated domain|nr:DedA family protein [Chloroflexota bacterium]GIW11060.1 MAG: hypothetical protein KatS3mg061_2117 [Dehalococcoidia bacterium]